MGLDKMASSFLRIIRPGQNILFKSLNKRPILSSMRCMASKERDDKPLCHSDMVYPENRRKYEYEATIDVPGENKNMMEKEENWISYGWSYVDRDMDEWTQKSFMFMCIVVVFGMGGLYLAYFPDFRAMDWARREAYLELARREEAGEVLISPDYVPRDKVKLPSDEELGNMDIVI